MSKTSLETSTLPGWIIWFLPVFVAFSPLVVKIYSLELYEKTMYGEFGMIETLTNVFLFAAVIIGVLVLLSLRKSKILDGLMAKLFTAYIFLFTLACFYFGGEEASWGQHYFGWHFEDGLFSFEHNKQGETNIHNSTNQTVNLLANTIPRFILTMGVLIGGIISPLVIKVSKVKFDSKKIWYWLFPTMEALPAAVFAICISLPQKFAHKMGFDLPAAFDSFKTATGEAKECLLGLFLFIYILSIYQRLKKAA